MRDKNEVKVGDRIRITNVAEMSKEVLKKGNFYKVTGMERCYPQIRLESGHRHILYETAWEFVEEEMVWISRDLGKNRRIDFHENKPDAYEGESVLCWIRGTLSIEITSSLIPFLKHIPEPGQALGIGKESGEILKEIWLDAAKKDACQPKEIIVDGVKYRKVED